jgi:hypothetical protein
VRQGGSRRTRRRVAFLLAMGLGLMGARHVRAHDHGPTMNANTSDDLRHAVSGLYGGDGIRLQPTGHDAHFTASSLQGLDRLNAAIATNVGLLSLNSSVSGFTFDVERGVPVQTTESLGPLVAERAQTIGARKFNVALSYTRINYSKFQGQDLDDLKLVFKHDDVNHDGVLGGPLDFERDTIDVQLNLKITEDIVALFGTYGLTDRWDVGVVVPIVHIHLRADAHATIIRRSAVSTRVHQFGPQSDPQDDSAGGDETGIGDVILRTKYNFLRGDPTWPDLAVVGEVKLPTGNPDDLLGTGETNFKALFVASRMYGVFTPHVNLGFEVSTAGTEEYNFRYILGTDVRLHPRVTAVFDILGRWEPWGDGIGDNTVDAAIGLKWNPWRSLLLNGGVQIPLNPNEGLRADVIWSVGLEYVF